MITIVEALEWLNQYDVTQLNPTSQNGIDEIFRENAKDREVRSIIIQILDSSYSSPNPLDYPEALLNVGVVEFLRGWEDEAKNHVQQAYMFFGPGEHRRAVAAWILGIVEWQTRSLESAHDVWLEARDIFLRLAKQYQDQFDLVKRDWYTSVVGLMSQDLCKQPLEIYEWFRRFDRRLNLSVSSLELINLFAEKMKQGKFDSGNMIIRNLESRAKDRPEYLETPEIFVECGFMAYKMGNIPLAIELYEKAVALFPPYSHAQVVARWMLGVLQWYMNTDRKKGIRNLEKGIEGFNNLAIKADFDNDKKRLAWYKEMINLLNQSLFDLLKIYMN